MMKCEDVHAGKCQDCPLLCEQCENEYWPWYCSENKTRWIDREADVVRQDCHLTPADFSIIRAMIAGTYDCGHCKVMIDFSGCPYPLPCPVREDAPKGWPCEGWQAKEDGDE